jgi:hypothetical protein
LIELEAVPTGFEDDKARPPPAVCPQAIENKERRKYEKLKSMKTMELKRGLSARVSKHGV